MADSDREKWDKKYSQREQKSPSSPSEFLQQQLHRLPRGGKAIDFAAGDGSNSLLLASRGWKVTAVDISAVGLEFGKKVAGPLPINWVVADLDTFEPEPGVYGLALCFRFFDRTRLPVMIDNCLAPGGYFVAETFNIRHVLLPDRHLTNPDFLVRDNEWCELLPSYEVLEHDQQTDLTRVVFRKPMG